MNFIKKHYEKILLSVVLLGLVGALGFLPVLIDADRERTNHQPATILPPPRPLEALNMTRQNDLLERLTNSYQLDFSTTNKLFNPVEWKKDYSGNLIKIMTGHEVDANAAVVTKITPLDLVVTLDSVQTNDMGALGAIYIIGVERQAAPTLLLQRKQQHYATKGEPVPGAFTITNVVGDPANPDQLILRLADTGEKAVLSKDSAYTFRRVDGYEADLKYDPGKKIFPGQRVGSVLPMGGEDYKIVAISQNEVILSAQSNQKKYTLRYAP